MSEIQRIKKQLRHAVEGGAWHGPSLHEIIGRLGAADAARRPLGAAHNPWEILAHVVGWLETVHRRLDGEAVEPTTAEDWPPISGESESAWADLRDRLDRAHETLQRRLDGMSDEDLGRRVTGQEYDAYFMLHGVVQHTLYHAGQIAILEKGIRTAAAG